MTQLKIDAAEIANRLDRRLFGSSVLITGATGLLGSQLVRALCEADRLFDAGITVYASIRNPEKAQKVFEGYDGIRFITGDVTEPLKAEGPIDYIIHAASETASGAFVKTPVETVHTTYMGTRNLLELAREKQVKGMVFLSSLEVFGTVSGTVREADLGYVDLMSSRSSYPESKRLAETMCRCYFDEYGVPVTVARLGQTFGAGVHLGERRIFGDFATHAAEGTDIVLHTTGETVGNYVYITDALSAILMLLAGGKRGEVYTVSNPGCVLTARELAEFVAGTIAEGKIRVTFDIPDTDRFGYAPPTGRRLNADKLLGEGFAFSVSLEEGFRRMIRSMREEIR